MSENRSCKAYEQKDIPPDLFLDAVPVNCGNCKLWPWGGEKCKEEAKVIAMQVPKEVVAFVRY